MPGYISAQCLLPKFFDFIGNLEKPTSRGNISILDVMDVTSASASALSSSQFLQQINYWNSSHLPITCEE